MSDVPLEEIHQALWDQQAWAEERRAIYAEEVITGVVDDKRIWASDDRAVDGYQELAVLLGRILAVGITRKGARRG